MTTSHYTKIVLIHPDRDLFNYLRQNILYENVEMFYFPRFSEIKQFFQRIKPHVLVAYVDKATLADERIVKFFREIIPPDVWVIYVISPQISVMQLEQLSDRQNLLVFADKVKAENVVFNIRTVLKKIQEDETRIVQREYAQNLLNSSKIISLEDSMAGAFEKLVQFLPKFLEFDYLALFTYDPEYSRVVDFTQFIPPQRRSHAILTPNLEKLAEVWLKRNSTFQVSVGDDPQLFRKLNEWGWIVKQIYFAPMRVDQLPIGGMIVGNTLIRKIEQQDLEYLEEIRSLLTQKAYSILQKDKSLAGSDDFADQLIYNRFSKASILQLACKKINELVGADNTIFWQINWGFGFIFPKFSYSEENRTNWQDLEKKLIYLSSDKKLGQAISAENIIILENISAAPHFNESATKTFEELDYNHLLIAPVRVQGESIGVFIANRNDKRNSFSAWEVERTAQLMEKIEKVLEDTQVVKEATLKLKQLSRIFELGNEIKLNLNIEAILNRITKSVRQTLGWNDVALIRKNNFRKIYKPISSLGFDDTGSMPLDIREEISVEKLDKFLLNCQKIRNSYFYDSQPTSLNKGESGFSGEAVSEWHTQDLLIIPVETYQKLLGFMVVRDPVDRLKPGEDTVISLEYFANQAAVAIQNSVLYETLLSSEERYRSLAETMTLALVTCSPDGRIIYVNPAFEHLVQKEKKKLTGQSLAPFFNRNSQKQLRDIIRKIIKAEGKQTDNIENIELELRTASDEAIPVSTFAFPLYQQRHKIGVFLVLNDLRVVKKLERLKSDFNSMIVHDLRSPMNVIQGFIELIRTRVVGEINSEQEDLLDIAKENVKKVLTLIDNFLVASKMEVGRFNIEPKVSEIHSHIERIVENHLVLLKNKQIKIETELNRNLPLLFFDSLRLEQVMNNLLSNAIKFTPEGQTIRVTTEFHRQKIKGEEKIFAKVGVHDGGPGIPEEKIKQIFEKYEQVDSGNSHKASGTGLGLAICREIIGLHGGEIWVESEKGKGSHFYFTLPVEPSIDKFLK